VARRSSILAGSVGVPFATARDEAATAGILQQLP
jgi:hypothetical protein